MFFKTNLYKKYKKEITNITEYKAKYKSLYEKDKDLYAKEELKTKEEILGYAASAISLHMGLEVRDEQFIAVLSLIDKKIIEMSTGEGKTVVGYLYAFYQLMNEKQTFIVTVNDYLVVRDSKGLQSLIEFMGRDVSKVEYITQETSHTFRLMYYNNAKVIYISSQQLMFDNLKNKMVKSTQDYYNIEFQSILLDEADLILLDESQNPFIIAGEDDSSDKEIHEILEFVKTKLKPYLEIKKDEKEIIISEEGYQFLEDNGYDILDYQVLGKINQSMRALFLFTKNVEYVVQKDKVLLIDAYTGRILDGRRLQDGLHQFLEAKEKVTIQNENRTIRSMTYPHFFSKFKEFVGMSGTLTESKDELDSIYGLRIEVIPTHKPSALTMFDDKLYSTKEDKIKGLVEYVKEKKPQPILIVTTNIEDTFVIEKALNKEKIKSQTLNAYNEEIESEIIAKAGTYDTVTIATNMAGRGTDIHVDEESLKIGGLICIGFEHNSTSRIDRQLVGRTARNGNPGESLFLTSLEDTWIPLMHEEYMEIINSSKTNEKKLRKVLKQKMKINDGFFKQFREQENKLQSLYGIHRDLLYSYREKILFAKTFNDCVETINQLLETDIEKSEAVIEINQLRNSLIEVFDSIIPEYLSYAESLKHNIQFFNTGDNPFTMFETLLMKTFEDMKNSYFKPVVEELRAYVQFEEKKKSIQKRLYVSPSDFYLYLFKNEGEKTINYSLEGLNGYLLKDESFTINKDGLVELFLGKDLKINNQYILTIKENDEVIEEKIIEVLELEQLAFRINQQLHYFLPSEVKYNNQAKLKDFVLFNSGLEIATTFPYATTVALNEKGNLSSDKYKLCLVIDDEIVFIQHLEITK